MKYSVKLDNIYKSFNNKTILNDISFSLPKNNNLVILGGSGSGKTILLKTIGKIINHDHGNILYEHDNESLNIGFLFQFNALFDSLSIRDNIGFYLDNNNIDNSDKKIDEILQLVDLKKDILKKYPYQLSGGMQKRVAVARVMLMKPNLLLFDEPTSGLDPINSQNIAKLINKVRDEYKGSSIVVTHDIDLAFHVGDFFAFIDSGKMTFWGNKKELLDSKCFERFTNYRRLV